ncbi:MAG: protein kinase [Chthoniobacterales bacterium]
MEPPGISDAAARSDEQMVECPVCGAEAQVAGGSCLRCLLRAGLEEPDETDIAAFDDALSEIDIRDPDWRLHNYKILEEIGRGGMGKVLEAVAEPLGRSVAVKVLINPRKGRRRFIREARITGQLQHPSIVPVHELGVDEAGHAFYTMKLVHGVTLRQILQDLSTHKPAALRNYSLPSLLTVFQKTCDAVAFAHAQTAPIIHRDLKPDNIMVGNYGEVLVMDWGAAKILRGEASSDFDAEDFDPTEECPPDVSIDEIAFATWPGMAMGTPGYMAPEQARGEAAAADERTDIYALGAILYSLLTLEAPVALSTKEAHGFKDQSITGDEVADQFATTVAPLVSRRSKRLRLGHLPGRTVPDSLVAVVLKAMALDPARRYANVLDLQADVAAYQRGFSTEAEQAGAWKKLRLLVARNKTLFAALAMTFGILLLATTVSLRERGVALKSNKELQQTLQRASLADHEAARQHFRTGAWREGVALLGRALAFWPENRAAATYLLSAIQFGRGDRDRLPIFGVHQNAGMREGAFSPDGRYFATASQDQTTCVWDAATGAQVGRTLHHAGPCCIPCFSPDSRALLTTGEDGVAMLWNFRTGELLIPPMRHGRPDLDPLAIVTSGAFSPDGKQIVTGSLDHTARVWDAASGKEITQLVNPQRVADVVFSPDGSRILTSYWYGGAMLWDAKSFQTIGAPMTHRATVRKSMFTPDGNKIVTSSLDKTARIWDGHTAEPLSPPLDHPDLVWSLDISADGKLLATVCYDKKVRLWSLADGRPVGVPMEHEGPVDTAAFSPDGKRLVSASRDKTARLWDVATCQPLGSPMRHDETVLRAIFNPDATKVLSVGWDGAAYLWHSEEPAWPGVIIPLPGEARAIEFDEKDYDRVFVAMRDGRAALWSLSKSDFVGPVVRHGQTLSSAAFHAPDNRIATAGTDGIVRFWDAANGKELGHTKAESDQIISIAFSPDGSSLFAAHLGGSVLQWKVPEGTQIGAVMRHSEKMDALAVAPSGKEVATGCRDDYVHFWDTNSGTALPRKIRHGNPVLAISYNPQGKFIATGCEDHTARLWSLESGLQLGEPFALKGRATAVRYTAGGKSLLVGGIEDTDVSCYNTTSHESLFLPLPHPEGVSQISSSASGSLVVTVTNDGVARLWRIPSAPSTLPNWLTDYLRAVGGLSFSAGQQLAQVPMRERLAIRAKLLSAEHEPSIWDSVMASSFRRDVSHAPGEEK